MVHPMDRGRVGTTDVRVTRLGLGTASFGALYKPVDTKDAETAITFAYNSGIRFFDTAPMYGQGVAEHRLGGVISGLERSSFVIATKVGYEVSAQGDLNHDFSYDGVMRQLEQSLKRLQVDRIDILHIHDPDDHYEEALKGTYRALRRLRDEGTINAVSCGMNQSGMLTRFAQDGEFDAFLLAGRYTLLDQSALEDLMPVALEKSISLFIGGPLNSGILADPYADTPMFNYQPADEHWVSRARQLDRVCKEFGVPLKAAALQFPLGHPAVASVVTGARSQLEIDENIRMLEFPIPSDLWVRFKEKRLLPDVAPTPDGV